MKRKVSSITCFIRIPFVTGRFLLICLFICSLTHTKCFAQQPYLSVGDTRNVNEVPGDFTRKAQFDFKYRDVVGVPGTGIYSTMMTIAPWIGDTGGKNHQLNFNDGGIFYRDGLPGSGIWEEWKELVVKDINGNLGIGTAAPSAKLHINAALDDAAIKIGIPNSPGNINVPFGASPGGYNIDFYAWRDIQADQIGARIRAERVNLYAENNALIQGMDLTFYTSMAGIQTDLTERVRILNNGDVAIGTTKSNGYKLAVNGKVRAQEIKVENANWPDYVFAKSYALPSLQETEKQIQETGHLLGIPSATEVKANGVDLGEMNAKLLQKIEELTLYLIEKNKEDQAKSIKIEDLEKRLKKLEK